MSTNYYAKHPGDTSEGLHIGKHSGGWEFLFRAHPELGLVSTESWRRFLDHPWVTIVAEYGVETSADEFWEGVHRWHGARRPLSEQDVDLGPRRWRDDEGNQFLDVEFC